MEKRMRKWNVSFGNGSNFDDPDCAFYQAFCIPAVCVMN